MADFQNCQGGNTQTTHDVVSGEMKEVSGDHNVVLVPITDQCDVFCR